MADVEYATGVYDPKRDIRDQIQQVLEEAGVTLQAEDDLRQPVIASSLGEAARLIIAESE
jgi:ABC-type multidrug transport system ATPase subunit